jgi:hypothetical protein
MIWWLLLVMSICTGVLRVPRWTVLVWPVASVALGIYLVADEPANYDMHGFGYGLGGFVAVLCVVAWLVGRGLAVAVHGRSAHHH